MPRRPPRRAAASAAAAPLRYVREEPGIRRERHGRGFSYRLPDGGRVTDPAVLRRVRSLGVPPAWASVWICTDERGHIQATGRDARGRKQYRYHPGWRALQSENKFEQLAAFGAVLPRLRRLRAAALAGEGLSRARVLAAVIHLLDSTYARVGNLEYRRTNGSFGLTTLLCRHAQVEGGALRLVFRGKSGIRHSLKVDDPRVIRIVRRCQSLPGQELFQYLDEAGEAQTIRSEDVNEWLREHAGAAITAKLFRTWHASALALDALLALEPPSTLAEARAAYLRVVDTVAAELGNTRAVCRRHYIHPGLEEEFPAGTLAAGAAFATARRVRGLVRREALLLSWLTRRSP